MQPKTIAPLIGLLALALLLGLAPARAQGGPASLIKDLDSSPYQPGFSMSYNALVIGSRLFFTASDDSHGLELWVSDGSAAGSRLVKDIFPGGQGSGPSVFVDLAGRLLFFADDGSHGQELWVSDGTPGGTTMVRDIAPGAQGSATFTFWAPIAAGGRAFFVADDGVHGLELWASDGTPAGTLLLKDIAPTDLSFYQPTQLTAVGQTVFFIARDGSGEALWRSDGTPAGTGIVRYLAVTPSLFAAGQKLYLRDYYGLSASDGTDAGTVAVLLSNTVSAIAELGGQALFTTNGDGFTPDAGQLWASDGSGSPRLVKVLGEAAASSFGPLSVGGKVYFMSLAANGAPRLWVSDGNTAGTLALTQLPAGSIVSGPIVTGGKTLFLVHDGSQSAIWKTDGTPGGTALVATLSGPVVGRDTQAVIGVGGRMIAVICDYEPWSGNGCTFWGSDGTAAGTQQLRGLMTYDSSFPLVAAGDSAYLRMCDSSGCSLVRSDGTPGGTIDLATARTLAPAGLTPLGAQIDTRVFFNYGNAGGQLWASDGTPGGTTLLHQAPARSFLTSFALVGGRLFFIEQGTPFATELWRSDGTPAGTIQLATWESYGNAAVALGNAAYITAEDSAGQGLWRSDGTPAGTVKVKPLPYIFVSLLASLGDKLLLLGDGALYVSDGTAAPELKLADLEASTISARQTRLIGGQLFMITCGHDHPCSLWRSDGTAAGTLKLRSFDRPPCAYKGGCDPDTVTDLTELNGRLYFIAKSGGDWGIWASDGTLAGTTLVRAIQPGGASGPGSLTVAGGRLFVAADDGSHGAELWASDGTPGGTILLKDIWPGAGSAGPEQLTAAADQLYFTASDPEHGRELWISDGTPGGTRLAADIWPGATGSAPANLAAAMNGQLYFAASNPAQGEELWVSDSAGTRIVQEIAPGAASANPSGMAVVGPHLLFSANDGVSGPALWGLPLSTQPYRTRTLGVSTPIEAEDYDRGGEGLAFHDADSYNRRSVYRAAEAVDTEAAGDGGYLLGWAEPGEWVNYSFDVTTARTYRLRLAVAAQGLGGSFHLELDGQPVGGSLSVPDSGGWSSWRELAGPTLELAPGRHTLRIVFDTAGPSGYIGNFDRLVLDGASDQLRLPLVMR